MIVIILFESSLTASFTYSGLISASACNFASDSESLINDSNYLTVILYAVFFDVPSFYLSFTNSVVSNSAASCVNLGLIDLQNFKYVSISF